MDKRDDGIVEILVRDLFDLYELDTRQTVCRTPGSGSFSALPGVQVTRRSDLVKKTYFFFSNVG